MKPNEWTQKYAIYGDKEYGYFGEVSKDQQGRINFKGTGIFYQNSDRCFIMNENMNNDICDGMFFKRGENAKPGVVKFQAGFYNKGKLCGPGMIFFNDYINDPPQLKFETHLFSYNENEYYDGPYIIISPNDKYIINECKNGVIGNKSIRFEYGKLYLDKIVNGEIKTINSIDCGWEYNFPYPPLEINLCFGFENHGIKPAFTNYDKKNKTHFYRGALQTYLQDQEYTFYEDGSRKFLNEVVHYGILPYSNGNKYFGEIKASGKEGEFVRNGFGCYRNHSEGIYCLGTYLYDERRGYCMVKRKNITYFGYYDGNDKDGIFFVRHDNFLEICTYDKNKLRGKRYRIYNDTFIIECVDESNRVLYSKSFDEEEIVKDDISNLDKISADKRELLEKFGLLYEVTSNQNIYVVGAKDEKIKSVIVPSFVKGIKENAFKGLKYLERVHIENGVQTIKEGAFFDCPNIREVVLPNTVTVYEPNLFNSKRLDKITIPKTTKLIKNYAFYYCSGLKDVKIEDYRCVIEKYAFPKKFKNANNNNTEEDKERKNKIKEKNKQKDEEIKNKLKKKLTKEKEKKNKIKKKKREQRIEEFADVMGNIWDKTKDVFKAIGGFFAKVFVSIGTFFGFIFSKIGSFFVFIFDKIKGLFRRRRYSYGPSFLEKIGDFFKMIGKGILIGITFPFKMIYIGVRSICTSEGGILIAGLVLSGVFVLLAITGWIQYLAWDVRGLAPKNNEFFGYDWNLLFGCIDLIESGEFFKVLLGLIFVLFAVIIDLVLYIIMAIFLYAIPVLLQIIIQLVLVFVLPPAIPIGLFVYMFKTERSKSTLTIALISTVATVIYFIFLSKLL